MLACIILSLLFLLASVAFQLYLRHKQAREEAAWDAAEDGEEDDSRHLPDPQFSEEEEEPLLTEEIRRGVQAFSTARTLRRVISARPALFCRAIEGAGRRHLKRAR